MRCATILLALYLAADWTWACSCKIPPPPKEALGKASAVFVAKVRKIETNGLQDTVTLRVKKSWKGVKEEEVQVVTASSGAACGVSFTEDSEWLIYTYTAKDSKILQTNICTRTKELKKEAEDEMKELGEPIWEKDE